MASKEAFLPVPTEDDFEQNSASYPSVPTYSHSGPGSVSGSTFVTHLNVDSAGSDDAFPNSSEHHMLCFNRCCDFRRAVLVVNGISILLKFIVMISAVIGVSYVNNNLQEIEYDMDEQSGQQLDAFVKSGGMKMFEALLEILETVAIALHACGIYGALKFKQWGIITAGATYALQLLGGLFMMDVGDIIFSALCLYPHIYMYKLMEAGIMTDINYHKIANCCGDRIM